MTQDLSTHIVMTTQGSSMTLLFVSMMCVCCVSMSVTFSVSTLQVNSGDKISLMLEIVKPGSFT